MSDIKKFSLFVDSGFRATVQTNPGSPIAAAHRRVSEFAAEMCRFSVLLGTYQPPKWLRDLKPVNSGQIRDHEPWNDAEAIRRAFLSAHRVECTLVSVLGGTELGASVKFYQRGEKFRFLLFLRFFVRIEDGFMNLVL